MRRRILRVLWRTFQAFLVLFVLAGIAVYFGRDELLRKAANELETLGLPPIELEIAEISLDRIGFSGVSIGDTVKVRDLKAGFAWREVLAGKFDRIIIENPEITVRQIDDRLDFGDLNPLIFAEDAPEDESDFNIAALQDALPFRRLILKNATIFVLSDQGTTELHFDADVSSADGDIKIEKIRLQAEHENTASFTAEAFATLSDDGNLKADLSNLFGSFDLGFAAGEAIGGKGHIDGNLLALETLNASFNLRLESVTAPFGLTGEAELEAKTTGTSGNFVIRAFEQSTGAASMLSVSAQNENDDHMIAVELQFSAPDLTAASTPFLPDIPLTGQLDLSITTASALSDIVAAGQLTSPWEQALAAAPIDLRITGTDLGLEVLPLGLDTTVAVRLETDNDRKALRFLEPLTMMAEAGHTETELYDTILPYLDTRYDGPLQADFGQAGDIALWLQAETPDAITAETDLQASFSGGGIAPSSLSLQGRGTFKPDAPEEFEVKISYLKIRVEEWISDIAHLYGLHLNLSATGTSDGFDGSAWLNAAATVASEAEDFSTEIGTQTTFGFELNQDQLDLLLYGCGEVWLDFQRVASLELLSKNNRFCLETDQAISFNLKNPALSNGRMTVGFPDKLLRVRLPDGQRIAVGGSKSSLGVSLEPAANDNTVPNVSADLKISSLYTTSPKLAAGSLSVTYDGDLAANNAAASLSIRRLESLENPAFFTPVTARDDIVIRGNEITHKGNVQLVSGDARIEFELSHDRKAETGNGTIRPIPLQFGPDHISLDDVSPMAGTFFRLFSATLLGAASLDWDEDRVCLDGDTILQRFSFSPNLALEGDAIKSDGGQLAALARMCQSPDGTRTSKGELLVENLNIHFGALELLRMNTVLTLPEIIPTLRTEPAQPFSIALANLGVPLTSGSGKLTIHASDSLDIDDFGFDWAGGKVTSGPVRVRDGTIAEGLKLSLSDIDLAELVSLLKLGEQLEALGTIGGDMTISFENGQPQEIDGILASEGNGILRYLGDDLGSDAASSLLATALSNFLFDKIEVKVSGLVAEEAKITLHLVGKNPDLHDGHPLDLEVSVNGRLADLFKDSIGAYQIPTQIKERMLGYGQ